MRKYRILVAGCGSIGQRHARLLAERTDVDLFLVDTARENLESCLSVAMSAKARDTYDEALSLGMDGVFICTPNHLHVDMAKAALGAGSHVLVEKPVADTAAEAMGLAEYGARGDRAVFVGYVGRFDRQLRYIKSVVDNGDIGRIVYANAAVYTHATLRGAKSAYRLDNEWSLVADYTHEIDFLHYLVGPVEQVMAMGSTSGDFDLISKPNVLQIVLGFRCSALGSVHMDYARVPDKRFLELVGDKGSIEFEMMKGIVRIYDNAQEGFRKIARPFVRDEIYRDQIQDFVDVIEGKGAPLVSLDDGINALKVAEAVISSCESGSAVKVGLDLV